MHGDEKYPADGLSDASLAVARDLIGVGPAPSRALGAEDKSKAPAKRRLEALLEDFKRCEALYLDFDGVFTNNTSSVGWGELYDPSPYAKRRYRDERCVCSHTDGLGLSRLREATGIQCAVITSQVADYVAARCDKLSLPVEKVRRSMGGEGKLASGKAGILSRLFEEHDLDPANVCFVGNDAPDVEALCMCGLSVAVADSEPAAMRVAKYATDREGGHGALRDVCDLILQARTGTLEPEDWESEGVYRQED